MSIKEKKDLIPKSGFHFKKNKVLWKKIIGINFFCLFFFIFWVNIMNTTNYYIAIYMLAIFFIFSNLFLFFILSGYDHKSFTYIDDSIILKEIIKRRKNFTFLNSLLFFVFESIVSFLYYFFHIPEYLKEHSHSHVPIFHYAPSTLQLIILIISGCLSILFGYLGTFLFVRGWAFKKTDSNSGYITYIKNNKIVVSSIIGMAIIEII